MRNVGLDELQTGIKIGGKNINNLRYVDDTTLAAEIEEKLKSLLMRMKEEHERAHLRLNIRNTKIMASNPIIVWQAEGEKVEAVTDFLFLSSKITADGDCSQEIRRRLLLGRKAMTKLDSVLKSRDFTANKAPYSQGYVFPVIMDGCESWTVKKAECQRIDAFELWCRRRLLKVPWTARRSNQSILREINSKYSLDGLMLKMKLQDLGHLI